ncbi:MAG: FHA domain-containing protein [Salinibacterium sp.]|nr:FHA domain-containing protein [Salinibacterium sp.]
MRMTEELDNTRPASTGTARESGPVAEIAPVVESTFLDETVADTVISIRPVSELVEPAVAVASPTALGVAVSASRPPTAPLHHTGVYSFRVGQRAQAILLDRPARVGREPAAPRVSSGVSPRLVRVPSPSHEVSGTHLELRQVGSSVIVTDLRSTNGSVVLQPGSVPRKLRQGESVVVSPGTLVDIGDENILHVLPMQRLA